MRKNNRILLILAGVFATVEHSTGSGFRVGELLQNKVALVTGAASGIGRAAAIAFAQEGAKVAVIDVAEAGGEETVALIRTAGGAAKFFRTDVTSADDVARTVQGTVAAFGRLDCAFNNAGVELENPRGEWGEVDAFLKVHQVNVLGVLLCMTNEIKQMQAQGGGGTIVNTASVAGMAGVGGAGYCSSKHAVIGLTRSAAIRFAPEGIRVNAVCPGAIRTAMVEHAMAADPRSKQMIETMHPMGRVGEPKEVADAVVWLCSDKSSFVTGHPLAIDGGFLAR
jgi:NAD(P)-dependent dehydrogenase (short-subunit alcohol dehydrogenase family)